MSEKFPKQVRLDPDEAHRVNRIYMARWMHLSTTDLDDMPQSDIDDIRECMWYESEKADAAKRRRRK